MNESIPTKIKNGLKLSKKPIRSLDKGGNEIDRIEYGKNNKYATGNYYKFTTDQENDPVGIYCEINEEGSITFSPKSLTEWRSIEIEVKKEEDTNDETVNVTIGEDRTVI